MEALIKQASKEKTPSEKAAQKKANTACLKDTKAKKQVENGQKEIKPSKHNLQPSPKQSANKNHRQNNKNPYDEIVTKHSMLVKRIARHLSAKMPASVQVDDLIQAGMVGLLEAAKKYDVSKGASFETFAGIRIRGAMLDEIRRGDWGPRSVYRNSRKVNEAIRGIEARLGRDAKGREIANEMGISFKEYSNIMKDLKGCRLFSFEDLLSNSEPKLKGQEHYNLPDANLMDQKFKAALLEAIETLSEREQLVLKLYYEQELNLKQIGNQLGVSESRVSQIHSQAAARLKSKLTTWSSP